MDETLRKVTPRELRRELNTLLFQTLATVDVAKKTNLENKKNVIETAYSTMFAILNQAYAIYRTGKVYSKAEIDGIKIQMEEVRQLIIVPETES